MRLSFPWVIALFFKTFILQTMSNILYKYRLKLTTCRNFFQNLTFLRSIMITLTPFTQFWRIIYDQIPKSYVSFFIITNLSLFRSKSKYVTYVRHAQYGFIWIPPLYHTSSLFSLTLHLKIDKLWHEPKEYFLFTWLVKHITLYHYINKGRKG